MLRIMFNIRWCYGTDSLYLNVCFYVCLARWVLNLCVWSECRCMCVVYSYVSLYMYFYGCLYLFLWVPVCGYVGNCVPVHVGLSLWGCEVVSLWFMIWSRRWAFSIRNIECPSLTTSTHHPPTHTHTHRHRPTHTNSPTIRQESLQHSDTDRPIHT